MMKTNSITLQRIIIGVFVLIGFVGVGVRFYQITENQFFYYDEGLYLNHGQEFLYHLEKNPPKSFREYLRSIEVLMHLALADAKALWFFLVSLRGHFFGAEAWFFSRLISAVFGSLTIGVVYLFAKKFYDSKWVGLLSLSLIALLPSHIFYSRLGIQEGLSTFCFMAGLYFYLFPKKFGYKTFLSGVLFACVFYTNYRMIIAPFLIAFCEIYLSISQKEKPNIRKYLWNTLTFFSCVFLIGDIDDGSNTVITFAWMFYQAHLAQGDFDLLNFFSYPYYIFKLESIPFALLLFGNFYYFIKKEWRRAFPFALICLQMAGFSLAQEKGARYLCVVMPLMAIAGGSLIEYLWREKKFVPLRGGLILFCVLLFAAHTVQAHTILNFKSDYKTAVDDLTQKDPNVSFISTQNLLQQLYMKNRKNIFGVPKQGRFFFVLHTKGYQYLILDPQAYISHASEGQRFHKDLEGYLNFIVTFVKPDKTYQHFNQPLLERFVLEHNVNLRQSLDFLRSNEKGDYGKLRVYSIQHCMVALSKVKALKAKKLQRLQGLNR